MKVTGQELAQLKKIERLFGEIKEIYSGLSEDTRFGLHHLHKFESSFEYCIKQGYKDAKDAVGECEKDTKSFIEEFREHCKDIADAAGKKYSSQHADKFMVYDAMWDSNRDDCDIYDYTAEFLLDERAEEFAECETIEACEEVMRRLCEDRNVGVSVEDEKMNLSYGKADLDGVVLVEVGSIGRWNGISYGLNILEPENIGQLLHSSHEQWMCYVDKATGEFVKEEAHHDGKNHYEYRELTCDLDKFEEMLEEAEPGGQAELVEKYTKSIGPRIAKVYGWDLEKAAEVERSLNEFQKEGYSVEQLKEMRKGLEKGLTPEVVKLYAPAPEKGSLTNKIKNASNRCEKGDTKEQEKIPDRGRE